MTNNIHTYPISYTTNHMSVNSRKRKIPRRRDTEPCMENRLYKDSGCKLSEITSCERDYIRKWCKDRYIDDPYAIRSIILWMRVKSSLSVFCMLKKTNKLLYMVLCIHLSMKWQGYTEVCKCNFLQDLREIDKDLSMISHQEMEFHVITNLNWDFGP